MNSSQLDHEVCRICLEYQGIFNWNDEISKVSGVSYKDCYYKYTQMEEIDSDSYPTSFCRKCANEVSNAHILFEKALKSFIVLQNSVKVNEYEYGPKEILYQSSTLDESNAEESHHNESVALEIDEVICYSPILDENIEDTANAIYECRDATLTHEKDLQSFESPIKVPLEKITTSFDIKLLNTSIDRKEENKKKLLRSLNTALKLKLRLQIRGSKLLKSFAKTRKTLPQTTMKRDQSNALVPEDSVTKFKRFRHSDQPSLTNILPHNAESQQSSLTKNFGKDDHEFKTSNFPLNNSNFNETDTNSCEPFCIKNKKQKEFSNFSVKKEEINTPPGQNYTEENNEENDLSSAASTTSSISKESQTLSKTEKVVESKKDNFKPAEISLLEKIYGKNFDMQSINKVSKPKSSQGTLKICQYCSLEMMGTHRLLAHEATHLEDRERNMVCPICGLKFYTKLSLSGHLKIHDANRQKQHQCEFCEKAFFHKGMLNVHRRKHLGLMVKCQMCPREFYRKVDLERHMPTHSASSLQNRSAVKKKYTVQCQFCNKAILTSSWKAHKAAHLKEPQVKCKICNKDFYSRTSCADHLHGVHRKTAGEYEENIHYYVDCTRRMSHLMIKQQEIVSPVIK